MNPLTASGHALDQLLADVRLVHRSFNHPAPVRPVMQLHGDAYRRGRWICSEVDELRDAMSLCDQADAYLDIIYFAIGGLVELGVMAGPLWDIVQAANMAKLWPDGKPRLNEENRVQKPPGWQNPEPALQAEILRQLGNQQNV